MAEAQFTQNFDYLQKYMNWLELVDHNNSELPSGSNYLQNKLWGSFDRQDSRVIDNANANYRVKSSLYIYKANEMSSAVQEDWANTGICIEAPQLTTAGRFIPFQFAKDSSHKAMFTFHYSNSSANDMLKLIMINNNAEVEVMRWKSDASVRLPKLYIGNDSITHATLDSSGISTDYLYVDGTVDCDILDANTSISSSTIKTDTLTCATNGGTTITVNKDLTLSDRDILYSNGLSTKWQNSGSSYWLAIGSTSYPTQFYSTGVVKFPSSYRPTIGDSKILCKADISYDSTTSTLTITLPS